MQDSSTAGLSLPSERIRIRTGVIVEKVGQGGSLLDARIASAVMMEIDLDPSRTYPITGPLGGNAGIVGELWAFSKGKLNIKK